MENKRNIILPKNPQGKDYVDLKPGENLVIVGANGAGKTRLGKKIDELNDLCRMISANRDLTMPETFDMSNNKNLLDLADSGINWNYSGPLAHPNKKNIYKDSLLPFGYRRIENRFLSLLQYLAAELSDNAIEYRGQAKKNTAPKEVAPALFDKIQEVWNRVFPHRNIELKSGSLEAFSDGSPYSGVWLSEGERSLILLMGRVMIAGKDGIIIIDGPELHIHRAVLHKLWDEAEKIRPDLIFIYITHDFDFAVSRREAKILQVDSFDGNDQWEWSIIEKDSVDTIKLTLLGSRENILLAEGTEKSLDAEIYKILYPEYLVHSSASYHDVIKCVKAFKELSKNHHKNIFGFIDRDRRTDEEINKLNADGIYTHENFSEAENILCDETLVRAVIEKYCDSDHKGNSNKIEEMWKKYRDSAIEYFEKQKEAQVALRLQHLWDNTFNNLGNFWKQHKTPEDILENIDTAVKNTVCVLIKELKKEKENWDKLFDDIIKNKDYSRMLKYFNQKGLLNQLGASEKTGFVVTDYKKNALYLLETDEALRSKIREKLHNIDNHK